MDDKQPNWAVLNSPWWQSYALWLERHEVGPPYLAKAAIGDRQLIVSRWVARGDASVRIEVVDHDWSGAYAAGRIQLDKLT